ncbi:S100P-binding protein-like isoform X2 [Silurus meridionalis]|uniref:S100P-binding protein-like isoform X2 n=1 Tax=Silurus meridionalis TaxID=175797 RepID=UPI001EEC44B2|nr:S100P-binding protein-like isoform X2 [Silurus meridionalis]
MELVMAETKKLIKTASHKHGSDETRHFSHFKPLSVYSRKVYCNAISSYSVNSSCSPESPLWNLKVELINSRESVGRKRRLDDSCLDETYDRSSKKPCLANRSSPHSTSVPTIDSFNAYRQVKLVSSQSSSVGLDEVKRIEKTLSGQKSLGLDWTYGSDMTASQSSTSLTNICSSSPVLVHNEDADVIAFDYDVDEIMCLSPIDHADAVADGLEDCIQSCPSEEGHKSWYYSKQRQGKLENSTDRDTQCASDEGYVTKSYCTSGPAESNLLQITVPNSSNTSPLASTPIMSTPLEKSRELVKCWKNDFDKKSQSSPTINCKLVKASSAISLNLDAGKTKALPTIPFMNIKSEAGNMVHKGTAVGKSSDNRQIAIQVKEDKEVLSVGQQQAGSENKLPLEVKSKVSLLDKQQPGAVKDAYQQPEKKVSEGQRNVFKDVPRPVLYSEDDWEKEKKVYVDSVRRHMADKVEHGVMTELLCLMKDVANQGRGGIGRRWQHPSDLTRRNYRLCNGSRLLSLNEWQNLNYRYHRRFAQVPPVFKRSQML